MKLSRRQFIGSLTTLLTAPIAGCWAEEPADELTATVFKADKADAILIQQGGSAILIDTGLEDNAMLLVQSLKRMHVTSLDGLIITHFDRDHVGGAATILRYLSVRRVFTSNYPRESDEYDEFVAALSSAGITPTVVNSKNAMMTLGSASVIINGPAEEEYDNEPSNNSSLITTVSFDKTTFLLMGDAEKARIKEFIAGYTRPEGELALKVPYHGHTQGQLDELIDAVKPDVAVITNGEEEPTADEISEVRAMLEEAGAQVYLTTNGEISLTFEGSSIIASQ